jgi:Na+-transporting methylmalonyl-CoA/oxaloacetate decarboxylase gamma subunit
MNLSDTLIFGVNTTIVCLALVFVVLIILAVIIILQSKILKLLSKHEMKADEVKVNKPVVEVKNQYVPSAPVKTGLTKGEAKLLGIEDEEHVAVIMAAVSNAANIPLTALRIKSIRRIDSTWETSSKPEQTNQRL